MRAYLAFVRDEVLPRFDDGSGKLVYQAEPSVRVCLPSARAAGGKARCDADHFHQPGEISPWARVRVSLALPLPLTLTL